MPDFSKKIDSISLTEQEYKKIIDQLKNEYETYLKQFDVKMPVRNTSANLFQLVCLRKYYKKQVSKDAISKAMENYFKSKFAKDQQVRHLAEKGWYVLNKGEKIPDTNIYVSSGYHMLFTVENCKKDFWLNNLKRKGRLLARNFEELKAVYGNRCATCGAQENKPHFLYPDKKTTLQQAHMDPSKPLTLKNTIPQCQYCNPSYRDKYAFDDKGRVVCVMNVEPVRLAPKEVQDKIFEMLKKKNT